MAAMGGMYGGLVLSCAGTWSIDASGISCSSLGTYISWATYLATDNSWMANLDHKCDYCFFNLVSVVTNDATQKREHANSTACSLFHFTRNQL